MNEHFDKGFRQAQRVAAKEPGAVNYWLARARRGRRRWKTRLFDWKKRRFLDGFILSLETHLKSRTPGQFPPSAPELTDTGSDIEIETGEHAWGDIGVDSASNSSS